VAVDIQQGIMAALVPNDLLKRLGLNVELASAEWGTVIKRANMREPVEQGGWSVFNFGFASFEMISPATNRGLRAAGLAGSIPGWPSDEKIEALRTAWFSAIDDAERRDLEDKIQQRAIELVPYIPVGESVGRSALRKSLVGFVEAPIPFLWNIEKRE
jgi:peptide/nickel transport system substrate-binding protein